MNRRDRATLGFGKGQVATGVESVAGADLRVSGCLHVEVPSMVP